MMPRYEWSVKEIAPNQFAVASPTVELLRFCSCSTTLTLPLNQIQVSVEALTTHPDTVATLSIVWVRVFGFPNKVEVRTTRGVELVAQAIGKLVEVDMVSLAGIGPVRLRIMCPNPDILPGPLPTFFFGEVGRTLTVELAVDHLRSTPPPDDPPSDGHVEEDEDSSGGRRLW
jgi:hypothetical protein